MLAVTSPRLDRSRIVAPQADGNGPGMIAEMIGSLHM
jgi:hypothetical protein